MIRNFDNHVVLVAKNQTNSYFLRPQAPFGLMKKFGRFWVVFLLTKLILWEHLCAAEEFFFCLECALKFRWSIYLENIFRFFYISEHISQSKRNKKLCRSSSYQFMSLINIIRFRILLSSYFPLKWYFSDKKLLKNVVKVEPKVKLNCLHYKGRMRLVSLFRSANNSHTFRLTYVDKK